MSEVVGHSMPMSLGRRITGDFLHVSRNIPLVSIQKAMNVAELVHARQQLHPRPSWCSIFTKAYAKVVAARPDLRRVCLTFPWERMFEYRTTSADVVVEARVNNEGVLVTVPLKNPQTSPLLDIDRELASCKEKPLERLRRFRYAMILARFPRFLRQWVWWYKLNVSGPRRCRYLGTFGVSSTSNWGVDSLRPISPWITLLHYGAIDAQGKVTVRLTFDHRVMDGSGSSQALNELERFLHTEMLMELKSLPLRKPEDGLLKAG